MKDTEIITNLEAHPVRVGQICRCVAAPEGKERYWLALCHHEEAAVWPWRVYLTTDGRCAGLLYESGNRADAQACLLRLVELSHAELVRRYHSLDADGLGPVEMDAPELEGAR